MRYIDTRSISSVSQVLERYHYHNQRSHGLHNVGLATLLSLRKKKNTLTKAQRKRIANQRRRKFVANIVVYHEKLHEAIKVGVIERERSRILSNIVFRPKSKSVLQLQREERSKKQEIDSKLSRARDRVYARRIRSRSRWNELLESQVKS
ncbi:MAG: hypothetical protein ACI9IL_000818 [Rickettsiales bacterium]|jgi:hypothetical protein